MSEKIMQTVKIKRCFEPVVKEDEPIYEKLSVGEKVKQKTYGIGVVSAVETDEEGVFEFKVRFDDGNERTFAYPKAFNFGMMVRLNPPKVVKKKVSLSMLENVTLA